MTGRPGRRHKKLLDDFMKERGHCTLKSHYVEKSLWKRLWTCCKTDHVLMMMMMMILCVIYSNTTLD